MSGDRAMSAMSAIPAARDFLWLFSRPTVTAALSLGFVAYFVANAILFHHSALWPLAPIGDASILFDTSREIVERGDYPGRLVVGEPLSVFPYPPSAVLLSRGLTDLSPAGFMAVWFALMATGLWITLWGSLIGEPREIRSAWLGIAVF